MIYQLLLIALIIEIVVAYRNPKYAVGICLTNIMFFPDSIKYNVGVNLNSFNLSVICVSCPLSLPFSIKNVIGMGIPKGINWLEGFIEAKCKHSWLLYITKCRNIFCFCIKTIDWEDWNNLNRAILYYV